LTPSHPPPSFSSISRLADMRAPLPMLVHFAAATAIAALRCVLQPVKPKDYRKQGPAGVGDKPYTMPKTKQDGPPPGGFAPIKTKRFVGVTTSIPSSVFVGLTVSEHEIEQLVNAQAAVADNYEDDRMRAVSECCTHAPA